MHNVVEVRTALAGTLTWHGAGAGGRSTASALLADTIAAARTLRPRRDPHHTPPELSDDRLPSRPDGPHGVRHAAAFTALSLACDNCGARFDPEPSAICLNVPRSARARVRPESHASGPRRDRAPRTVALALPRVAAVRTARRRSSPDSGFTPLVEAPELARRLGVARAWVKNDAVSHPTLSFKDRVVSTAINAAHAFGLDVIGCASTGKPRERRRGPRGARGLDGVDLHPARSRARQGARRRAMFAPKLVRVRGTYDDVNRLCAQVADSFGWGLVNVNLRAYYGEGSKTMAFEIIEQLGWRAPTAVVAPMAGGALVTKLHRGFREFSGAGLFDGALPRLYGAQAAGCSPIVRLVERGGGADRARDPVDHRPVARHRQPGGRPDRRARASRRRGAGRRQ